MSKEKIQYQIREAHPQDASALVELVSRGMMGYPFESVYNEQLVAESINEKKDRRVVAVENQTDRLLGTAVLGDRSDHMQEIKRVVVDPDVRKNGVASAMTESLALLAKRLKVVSWADARADQPGMQSAALRSGHQAVSLETGKHCVYWHLAKDDDTPVGPARETMVHLTSLPVDTYKLQRELLTWPESLVGDLIASLTQAMDPQDKNPNVVEKVLPNAAVVKKRITENVRRALPKEQLQATDNPDIMIVHLGKASMVVIAPDASGFVISRPNADLKRIIELGQAIGLQTVTSYVDVQDTAALPILQSAGLRPTMLRVWQESKQQKPQWQVGWRAVANDFEQSLHYLRLHPEVEEQVWNVISSIS